MNIYIGNLSYDVNDDDLKKHFAVFGQVVSASVVKDKYTGKSRGFGFVEMLYKTEAQSAMEALNGKELNGKTINVNEARIRPDDPRSITQRYSK
jgi:RNA recognition motif-containing protein